MPERRGAISPARDLIRAGLCALTVASSLLTSAPRAAETIKFALNVPLTGAFANIGDLYVKNSQFAIDSINARGGVMGRKLEVVAFDNKGSPREALLALNLIRDQKIPFMIQAGGSHIAVPLAEAVRKYNEKSSENQLLFLVEPGDQELSNEKCNFWTFTFMANLEVKMEALTTHIASSKSIKRVYLINQDFSFGQMVASHARAMLKRKRPDIVLVGNDLHPLGTVKDFWPYVSKIKAAKADVIITGNWGNDMALLVKAAKESGLQAIFYTYYGIGPGAPTAMGAAAAERVRIIWRWHPNLPFEKERQSAEAFKHRFGLEYYAIPIYNLFDLVGAAINQSQSTNATRVAFALENQRLRNSMGEVWMRPEDHQLFEPLYISTLVPVGGAIKHDMENTGLGTRTDARFEVDQLTLPSRCQMRRPPAP